MYYLACCTRTVVFVSRNRGCSFEGANYGTCRLHRWDSQKHTQAAKYRVVLHGGTPTGTCVSVSHACLRIRRKPLRNGRYPCRIHAYISVEHLDISQEGPAAAYRRAAPVIEAPLVGPLEPAPAANLPFEGCSAKKRRPIEKRANRYSRHWRN